MVRNGQSLIEIDPRPYEAQLKQAEGTLQHDQGLLSKRRSIWPAIRKPWRGTLSPIRPG